MMCEKCWRDAGVISASCTTSKTDEYEKLIEARKDNPCSDEEQCGEMHTVYPRLNGLTRCVCEAV